MSVPPVVQVSGTVDGTPCRLVVDTGAERTFVRADVLRTRNLPRSQQQLCGVTGHCVTLRGPVQVQITIGGAAEDLPVYVADMEEPCLLGMDFLARSEACVDVGRSVLRLRDTEVPLLLTGVAVGTGKSKEAGWSAMQKQPEVSCYAAREERLGGLGGKTLPTHVRDLAARSSAKLTPEQKQALERVLCEYADVFSQGDHDLGRTSLVKHTINTANHAPIKQPPRRVAPAKREEMQRLVEEMAAQGVIERSDSPWSSPVVLVGKKDGSQRFCVDYRALNEVTVKDSYPLPRIDDTLDALGGVQWLSTLDLKSGYHQVEMADEDKQKTAFSFGQGLWQFRVMPFGACNAPSCFMRLMEKVLEGLQWQSALVYLDDILVYGNTFQEELERLVEVLTRLRRANLKLSPKKCTLFQHEVQYLGHLVGRLGVRTDPGKVAAVVDWPTPTSVGEVRSFMGLCTYYRRFVEGFATIAAPLHQLTRKDARFEWDEACQAAFEALKASLARDPVLAFPLRGLPYLLDTDASAEGVGAVLSQMKDGKEHVVAFYSAKFSRAERNYCVTRKELVAMVKSLKHFHPYLYGTEFTIRTDHAALRWLKTLRDPEGQLARWLGRLEQYHYRVVHRAGKVHHNADSLSRRPCEEECEHCRRRELTPRVQQCCRVTLCEVGDEEKWREAQRGDSDLAPLMRWLERDERPGREELSPESPATKFLESQWAMLRLENGVLQRRWEDVATGGSVWLLVVPRTLRAELLGEAHGGVSSGHLGRKKTLCRLRERTYWVGMRSDVAEWCKVCQTCAARKGPAHRTRAPLQLHQVAAPMERVAVDIAGPFPCTPRGNRFICVAMDYFTKWPEAYAVPDHAAETVAEVLVSEFFTRFGMPGELHSDQGREFESRVFKQCCELLGVQKTRTTPLHPQSDGMVERFNRTLADELAKYCSEDQQDWDLCLPFALMAYRTAQQEATGYTPSRLMFGREIRLPLDLTTGRPPGAVLPESAPEYVVTLRERMEATRQRVAQNLQLAGQAMFRWYLQRARGAQYAAGDLVWLHNPRRKRGLAPKLQSSWEGPYTVKTALSDVTYRLQGGPRNRVVVVHVDRLCPYHDTGQFTWDSVEGAGEDRDLASDPLPLSDDDSVARDVPVLGTNNASDSDTVSATPHGVSLPRRPERARRPPMWMDDYVPE